MPATIALLASNDVEVVNEAQGLKIEAKAKLIKLKSVRHPCRYVTHVTRGKNRRNKGRQWHFVFAVTLFLAFKFPVGRINSHLEELSLSKSPSTLPTYQNQFVSQIIINNNGGNKSIVQYLNGTPTPLQDQRLWGCARMLCTHTSEALSEGISPCLCRKVPQKVTTCWLCNRAVGSTGHSDQPKSENGSSEHWGPRRTRKGQAVKHRESYSTGCSKSPNFVMTCLYYLFCPHDFFVTIEHVL